MKKAKNIFITATNTNVGKTYTTLKLIEIFSLLGYKVGVMKPIESGVTDIAEDATLLLERVKLYNDDFLDLSVDDIAPIQLKLPAAPYVANALKQIDLNIIKDAHKKLSAKCDLLLIEGAGGLYTPINRDFFMIDLISLFDAKTLLVCSNKLGCINDALLNINTLKSKNIDFIWAINQRDEEFNLISKPYFDARFKNTLYIDKDLKQIASNLSLLL
jgi:dethiobiotin synthetase